eukprot:jgi/Botrbrau1/13322/Bobra.0334s0002.2
MITLRIAARGGNLPLLELVHDAALLPRGFLSHGISGLSPDERYSIKKAARDAAEEGHAACLAALVEWFGIVKPTVRMSWKGIVHCPDALGRMGCVDLVDALSFAAGRAQLECIKYLVNLDPGLLQMNLLSWTAQARKATPRTIIDCMDFLQCCGCKWTDDGWEMLEAAYGGHPEVLQYCLVRGGGWWWKEAMFKAYVSGSVECMQMLYDNGYEQHRLAHGWPHPATFSFDCFSGNSSAIELECVRLMVLESGKLDPEELSHFNAIAPREDVVRYMIQLGAPLDDTVTIIAAAEGRVELLRYALENGAPWTTKAVEAAIKGEGLRPWLKLPPGNTLECLRCLCEHARAAGFSERLERPAEAVFAGEYWQQSSGPSLAVLQYVCDHMGSTWAGPAVQATAQKLAGWALEVGKDKNRPVDWQLVLFLARKLGDALPHPLGELVAVRRERAAALAGAFFKAGQLAQQSGPGAANGATYPPSCGAASPSRPTSSFRDLPLAMALSPASCEVPFNTPCGGFWFYFLLSLSAVLIMK